MKPTNMKKFYSKKDYILVNKTLSSLKPLFTPNLNEANFLLNKKEPNIEKIFESLENFYKSDFVITGGDVESSFCEDYLKENKKIYRLKSKKIEVIVNSRLWMFFFDCINCLSCKRLFKVGVSKEIEEICRAKNHFCSKAWCQIRTNCLSLNVNLSTFFFKFF